MVVALSAGWTLSTGVSHGPIPWLAVIYLGLFATAATTFFQTLGQKWVSAPQAAVLFTVEPVWASIFGWIFLSQMLGIRGLIGGAMILGAAVSTQLPSRSPNPTSTA